VDNIAWIDLGQYAVVVDALEQPHLEREVFEAILATLGERTVRYVLNTHTHYDHVALNAAFRRHYGSQIVNRQTASIGPEGQWFEGSTRRVQMLPMPGCHTDEDCIVWAPDDAALFVGDIFGWGCMPLSVPLDGQAAKLLDETYAKLVGFGASVVIPGHGPVCTTAELKRFIEYLHWLKAKVDQAVADGKSDGQIMRQVAAPPDMKDWWRLLLWKHEDTLGKVIEAVRSGRWRT
jgi:cyclase